MLDTVYTLSLAFTIQLFGARISFPDFEHEEKMLSKFLTCLKFHI